MNLTRCKRCRQVILWTDNAATGRPIALDAVPHPDGTVAMTPAGAMVLTAEQADMGRRIGSRRYRRHLDTCPRAKLSTRRTSTTGARLPDRGTGDMGIRTVTGRVAPPSLARF